MAKETFYFSHDYNARSDTKIKKLIAKHGFTGYGIYWSIVEDLYQNANALQMDYECIAYDMRSTPEIVKSVVEDFGLFQIQNGYFGSLSIQRRIEERDAKSQKARESAFFRWNKDKLIDANALPPQSECNAIKDSIVNESKGEEIISPKEKSWREDFEVYKSELREFYKTIRKDNEWILNQQRFNPNVNILLTLEKAVVNYWATEAGWKNKKRSKSKTIDWKSTLTNALSNPSNKVYLAKDTNGGNTDAIMHRNSKGEVLHRTEWIEDGIRYYGSRQGRKYQVPMDMSPRPSEQFSLSSRIENGKEVFNWIIQ